MFFIVMRTMITSAKMTLFEIMIPNKQTKNKQTNKQKNKQTNKQTYKQTNILQRRLYLK